MSVITPYTTVSELLEEWPSLEDDLIAMAPPLAKLRNPVLREAVGKHATLDRVAELAGIDPRELVTKLRQKAGLPDGSADAASGAPEWACEDRVKVEIDADSMLKRGVHPIGAVREAATQLQPGDLLRLTSGFRPQPLIELMRSAGLDVWCEEKSPGHFVTLMRRGAETPGPLPESCAGH